MGAGHYSVADLLISDLSTFYEFLLMEGEGGKTALENAALERKARLKALKEKKGNAKEGGEKPKLKFRSYNPLNEELKERKVVKAKPEDGKWMAS